MQQPQPVGQEALFLPPAAVFGTDRQVRRIEEKPLKSSRAHVGEKEAAEADAVQAPLRRFTPQLVDFDAVGHGVGAVRKAGERLAFPAAGIEQVNRFRRECHRPAQQIHMGRIGGLVSHAHPVHQPAQGGRVDVPARRREHLPEGFQRPAKRRQIRCAEIVIALEGFVQPACRLQQLGVAVFAKALDKAGEFSPKPFHRCLHICQRLDFLPLSDSPVLPVLGVDSRKLFADGLQDFRGLRQLFQTVIVYFRLIHRRPPADGTALPA